MSVSKQKKGTWYLNDAFKRIAFGCWGYAATDSTGKLLYAMGRGAEGQFGNCRTDISHIGFPQELPGADWTGCLVETDGSYRSMMIRKADGSYWAVGNNDHGKLGTGDGSYRSSPTQLAGNWCMVTMSHQMGSGVKCDGTMWTWGYGAHGQRGLSTPTCNYTTESCAEICQVGTCTNWTHSGGGYHSAYGIRSDNTGWGWGYNGHGELAQLVNTCCYSSPIQIPGSWCELKGGYPSMGKKVDGSYWVWGHNPHGNIGNGTASNNYCSPIAIPGIWIQMTDGRNGQQMLAGIKNDNTLWTWGLNSHGALGNNTTTPTCSPIQVPGSWKYVATGHRHTVAVKTDGTLWGWGHNTGEQRYHCSAVDFSSPIQLPGTNWVDVAGSYDGTYARKSTPLADDL